MPPNQPEPRLPDRVSLNSISNDVLLAPQRAVNISPANSTVEHYFYAYKPQASKTLVSSSTSTNNGFVDTYRFRMDSSFEEPYDDINANNSIDNSTKFVSSIYLNK